MFPEEDKSFIPISVIQQKSNRIALNCMGTKFEITSDILHKFPNDSRLGALKEYYKMRSVELLCVCDQYDLSKPEFFFNRDPDVLKVILKYVSTGQLHMNASLCEVDLEDELKYWRFNVIRLAKCCSLSFEANREKKLRDARLEGEIIQSLTFEGSKYTGLMDRLWGVFESPKNSKYACAYFVIKHCVLFLWVIYSIMLSMPEIRSAVTDQQISRLFGVKGEQLELLFPIADLLFFTYFLLDLFVRFIVCTDKKAFKKSLLNIIDAGSIALFFLLFSVNTQNSSNSLLIDKIRRIAESTRILLLAPVLLVSWRTRSIFQVLTKSCRELVMIVLSLTMFLVFVSTVVFYIELDTNGQFTSIPITLWWAIVTMTTDGYRDMVPTTLPGRFISGVISLLAPVLMSMFVVVLARRFSDIYSEGERKNKMVKACENACKRNSDLYVLSFR